LLQSVIAGQAGRDCLFSTTLGVEGGRERGNCFWGGKDGVGRRPQGSDGTCRMRTNAMTPGRKVLQSTSGDGDSFL